MLAGFSVLLLMASSFFINQQFSLSSTKIIPAVTSHIPSLDTSVIAQPEEKGLQDYYAKRLGQLQAESINRKISRNSRG